MKPKQAFNILSILSWVIFIGLCIQVGATLFSTIISLFVNPEASENLYLGLNLSELFNFSQSYFIFIMSFIIIITALKAYLFYLVIKVLRTIKIDQPFRPDVSVLINKISYYALVTGTLAVIANSYSKWLLKKGVEFQLDWGSTEFIFMAGILYIIAYIFKRGIEIQQENELTI